jgi:hypothetical protein
MPVGPAPSSPARTLPPASQQVVTGREFFPALICGPFHQGLDVVFIAAASLSAVAAFASLLRGGRYVPPESAPPLAIDGPTGALSRRSPHLRRPPRRPAGARTPHAYRARAGPGDDRTG